MDNEFSFIEMAEREIERDKNDLTRLKARYPGYDFVKVGNGNRNPSIRSQRTSNAEVEGGVLAVMAVEPYKQWTSRMVVDHLRHDGFPLPAADGSAMNAVGLALNALADNGDIRKVYEGKGRDPNRYDMLVNSKQNPAEAGQA